MSEYAPSLAGIQMPEMIRKLPIDPIRKMPVPFFVAWVDGKPEFRGADQRKLVRCITENLCWVCGGKLGNPLTFLIGPMCAVNRVSSEPPSHRECAMFSIKACPFLSRPAMERREGGMEDAGLPAGEMLRHNPGVSVMWTTRSFQLIRESRGVLFQIGQPIVVTWWTQGRPATREEALKGMDVGYPTLMDIAEKDGPDAVNELRIMRQAADALLPAA